MKCHYFIIMLVSFVCTWGIRLNDVAEWAVNPLKNHVKQIIREDGNARRTNQIKDATMTVDKKTQEVVRQLEMTLNGFKRTLGSDIGTTIVSPHNESDKLGYTPAADSGEGDILGGDTKKVIETPFRSVPAFLHHFMSRVVGLFFFFLCILLVSEWVSDSRKKNNPPPRSPVKPARWKWARRCGSAILITTIVLGICYFELHLETIPHRFFRTH